MPGAIWKRVESFAVPASHEPQRLLRPTTQCVAAENPVLRSSLGSSLGTQRRAEGEGQRADTTGPGRHHNQASLFTPGGALACLDLSPASSLTTRPALLFHMLLPDNCFLPIPFRSLPMLCNDVALSRADLTYTALSSYALSRDAAFARSSSFLSSQSWASTT